MAKAMGAPTGMICHYCDEPATTWDHIVPKGKGGPRHARWNQVPSCYPCNEKKKDDDPTCKCNFCLTAVLYFRTSYRPSGNVKKDLWSNKQFQKWYKNYKPRGARK